MRITLSKESFIKNGTRWVSEGVETSEISEENYLHYVSASRFFRRLGGYERNTKGYTLFGYRVVENISISPCRKIKKVAKFEFRVDQ